MCNPDWILVIMDSQTPEDGEDGNVSINSDSKLLNSLIQFFLRGALDTCIYIRGVVLMAAFSQSDSPHISRQLQLIRD